MELQLLVSPCHLYILYILSRGEQEEQEEEVQRLLLSSGCSIRSIERLFFCRRLEEILALKAINMFPF